ncbi:MAG TPA: glycosyltransferase [Syntrophales bacterium]|nr:glycosyltransferase [Syntrophales bacterium]HOL59837.1 glycosyltransferase [Syntrophales bacterium]HPO35945.1 glycosyltransferase [Syntrophales bacterium]
MRVAMLSPIAWRTPPRHYGPWENVVSLLTEGLVKRGVHVTLFATLDSQTKAVLRGVCPRGYEEDRSLDPKVWEALHISHLFESAKEFDIIHNHFDFLPLTYTGLTETPVVTTIHGFSSPKILPVYEKYNDRVYYVAISEADKNPRLSYVATIHHGIDLSQFTFRPEPGEYLLFFGRIHHEKGTRECIEIAQKAGMKLVIAGIIQDQAYFENQVRPFLSENIVYVGSAGPEERNDLLGKAYALLHPINFDEPFGLSVVEAMACGTPVVAVNRGSMPEVVAHEKTGFLVSRAEEMVDILPQVRNLNRIECRKWVEERFTVERMVDDYLHLYERILNESKREDHRPWGFYEVLSDEANHKVKRITVYPGARLSYQRHKHRSEHWYVVEGRAIVTLNGEKKKLHAGEAIDLPRGAWHRIENEGEKNLVFIEVQTGDYFGEDDIERSEDDYGRA